MFRLTTLFVLLLTFIPITIQSKGKPGQKNKPATNESYKYISANEILMWVGNNGSGSHDPRTDGPGLLWPDGEKAVKSLVFQDGLIWGGKVNGEIRANGNTTRAGLQPGKILDDGSGDNPQLKKYRVYKLYRYWKNLPPGPKRESYEKDFNEFSVEDGAPWIDNNGDGEFTPGIDEPEIIGDEMLWFVSNDLDAGRSTFAFGTLPIGLEIQTTVFAYDRNDFMKNTVIKKYKIINKSGNTIEDMIFGYWSDPDIGDGLDDFIGVDTTLQLAYSYNRDDYDEIYGDIPPAVGYKFLSNYLHPSDNSGSQKIKLGAFVLVIPSETLGAGLGIEYYNYLLGKTPDGYDYIDPTTNKITTYLFPGDPVTKEGWIDSSAYDYAGRFSTSDRRMIIALKPFNFEPGDTAELNIGIIIARKDSALGSVKELKSDAKRLQIFFDNIASEVVQTVPDVPESFYIGRNYPNPFNSQTRFDFELPIESQITIELYNILGEKITTLVNRKLSPGKYKQTIDSGNLSSGVYFVRFDAQRFAKTFKISVLK